MARGGYQAQVSHAALSYVDCSLFDNAATSWTQSAETARGMILVLDMTAMTCNLEREYLPYANETSESQGSTRQQPNGDVLAG